MNPDIGADLQITRLAGRGGALIGGLKLGPDLHPATVSAIRSALLEHKVIFFRDQQHLTDRAQEGFAKLLGELLPHPTVPSVDGTDVVLELDSAHGGRADSWHTDVTFVAAYPMASVLRGVVIPEAGGDTIWSNTEAAYANLPTALARFADELRAIHTNQYDYAARRPAIDGESRKRYYEVFTSTVYETEHPVVRVHPETGRRTLVLGHFLQRFVGFPIHDSRKIFELLQSHVTLEENTIRWRWRTGDVAIWDNRATQHKAINDYGDARRIVHRVTIAGDVPVGVDGRPSESRLTRENPAARRAA